MKFKWEILILTQPSRAEFLKQLLGILDLPLGRFSKHSVSVFLRYFDPNMSLGENREHMRRGSAAEYISFLDDDDFVSPDFVQTILPLLDGVDQVSFDVEIYRDEKFYGTARHSLLFNAWSEKQGILYRDISHVHPMRRELALEVEMSGGNGEDYRWADRMRGRVKTEHHVDRAMYYYLWRTKKDDTKDQLSPTRLRILEKLKSV